MGHERIGRLPRTVSWQQIVGKLADAAIGTEADVMAAAAATIEQVRFRFENLHKDKGVQAAFGFLVAIARACPPTAPGRAAPDVPLPSQETPLRLAVELNQWVDSNIQSHEYAELAKRAAAETLALWHQQQSKQSYLFSNQAMAAIWATASTGSGFSEISRLFLASFTSRYIRYFLDREASAVTQSIDSRIQLDRKIQETVDLLSRHAFDTAKIAQSFAAGWFNKHAKAQTPANQQLSQFLRVAFAKIREELKREALA